MAVILHRPCTTDSSANGNRLPSVDGCVVRPTTSLRSRRRKRNTSQSSKASSLAAL